MRAAGRSDASLLHLYLIAGSHGNIVGADQPALRLTTRYSHGPPASEVAAADAIGSWASAAPIPRRSGS